MFGDVQASSWLRVLRLAVLAVGGLALAASPAFGAGSFAVAEPGGDDDSGEESAPEPPRGPCAAQRATLSRASSESQMFNMSRFFVNGGSEGAAERSNQMGLEIQQRVAKAQEALQACYEKAVAAQDAGDDAESPAEESVP